MNPQTILLWRMTLILAIATAIGLSVALLTGVLVLLPLCIALGAAIGDLAVRQQGRQH